jgi:hypothetical protein
MDTDGKRFVILRAFVSSWWIGPGLYHEDAKDAKNRQRWRNFIEISLFCGMRRFLEVVILCRSENSFSQQREGLRAPVWSSGFSLPGPVQPEG